MEALQKVNIPFTDTSFASLLATGSMLSSQLLKIFVKPTPFEDRAQKSLKLVASKNIKDALNDGVVNGTLAGTALQLVVFNGAFGELAVNPEEYDKIIENEAVTMCNLTLNQMFFDDSRDTDFANLLRGSMEAACPGDLTICEPEDCLQDDEGDFYDCKCQVVVGIDTNDKVFIASVAYETESFDSGYDVQLLGLYDASSPRGESSILGFPLNSPAVPSLIPRFRNFQNFTNLVSTALSSFVEGLDVDFQFVPADPPSYSRFEVNLNFGQNAEFGATFDGSFGIGGTFLL